MQEEKKQLVPPYPSRGVQNTLQNGLRACVDWLQVTFKTVENETEIIHLLGLEKDDFTYFETGKYGFNSHARFGHISIYFSTNPVTEQQRMTHLEMTGQGCREYEQFGKYDWNILLGMILMLQVNITRFDIAIDDFQGYFTLSQLEKKIYKGHVRSRFRKARIMKEVEINDGSTIGQTIYFGSPSSEIQVRVYNKYQQQISLGKTLEDGVTFWNRTEIQMRDKRALIAAFELVENIQSICKTVQGVLNNYINFCDPSDDTNKSRWKVSKFWLKFIDNVEKLKLTQVAPDATIERAKDWFDNSVAPTFALLMEAYDNNEELIMEWLKDGQLKRSKKHENMLKRYKKEQDLKNKILVERRDKLQKSFLPSGKVHKPVYKKESSWPEDSQNNNEI